MDEGRFLVEGRITRLETVGGLFEAVIEADDGATYRYLMDPDGRRFRLEPVEPALEVVPEAPTLAAAAPMHRVVRHRRCAPRD